MLSSKYIIKTSLQIFILRYNAVQIVVVVWISYDLQSLYKTT